MFDVSTITNAGAALLEQWAAGGTLVIVRAAAGSGTVPAETLASCQTLANEVQAMSIVAKNRIESGGMQFHLQFQQIARNYTANQVGVWARIDNEGQQGSEVLLAIYQDQAGFEIPSTSAMQDFNFAFYALIGVDNRGRITAVMDSNAYLTRKVLEEVEQDLTDLSEQTTAHIDEQSESAVAQIKADTADALEKMEKMLNRAALPSTTITIPAAGWTPDPENGGLNSIVIKDAGVVASNKTAYFADLVQSGSEDSDALARDGWTQITRMVAGDGQVTVYALEVPETPFQTQIVALEVKEGTGIAEIMILRRGGTGVNSKDISKAIVTLDHDSFVYDESEHSPVITKVTLRGNQLETPRDYIPLYVPATNVGGYSIVILGVREYGGVVEAPWSITQAAGSVSLSNDTLTVKGVMGTVNSSVTVTRKGTGTITAESLSPANATAEIINGNTVKVTSVKAGQAKIKIKVAETTNYAAAETELTVTVEKATGSISVQPTEITIQGVKGTTAEVTLQVTGDGTVTVDTSRYVTTQITGNKLKLTSVEAGSQTLNIKLAETENYTGASCTLAVEVQFASKTLNDNSWETIAGIAASGKAQEFWQVGDEKEITINGETYHVQIIGFDHDDLDSSDAKYSDSSYNGGKKKAAITFQMKECLTQTYRMDETNSNSCSWRDSEMRVTTMPIIKGQFDQSAVAVMRTVTKSTAHSQTDSTIYKTADVLFLLCHTEVFDTQGNSHPGEGTQYAFYAAANDKIKKNLTGSAVWWWLRSPSTSYSSNFRVVNGDGTTGYYNANDTSGSVAAGFCV